jgi:raffinose/stachyose/melibiose transport system permease protein
VIALVVVAVMWKMIYDPDNGALNRFLGVFGIEGKSWLGDFSLALPSVGFVGTWVYFGLAMVLLTAGVQKIPASLYDAARVDGAGAVREFFAVTLPALRGEIAVTLTLTTVYALRNFDLVYITTKGGPGNATSVPAYQVYDRAFQTGQVGSAAAVGITLALIIFAITFVINRVAEPMTSRNEQTSTTRCSGCSRCSRSRRSWASFHGAAGPERRRRVRARSTGCTSATSRTRGGGALRDLPEVLGARRGRRGRRRRVPVDPSGYAFGMMRFRGSQVLFYVFLLGLMVR